ncbi:low temperature requirement protein A [Kribbella sp. NBC_00382]|uniref:low temperature requirement protein A n=1 Tax=Kribbella sp. NBC_00382 TaxID=2975967 RepID=UPI002E21C819
MKRVTWLELFFDLVFVFAVTSASELVHNDHSWLGVSRALIVFIPVFWVWVGGTMHANLHEIDTVRGRLGMFGVAFCGLILGLSLPGTFDGTALWFGGTYWVARLVLLLAIHGLPHRAAFTTFTVGAFLTGPLFVAGALLPPAGRTAVWAVAALTDLSVPFLARKRLSSAPFDASHVAERFGLFVIIALGETVVATGAAAAEHQLDALGLAALAAAFAVCCGLWWVYFAFSATAIHQAIESSTVRIDIIRPVLSYGHLMLIAGIIGVAAAIGTAVRDPAEPLHLDAAALLLAGTCIYLGAFAFTRWHMFHTLATPRLIAAAACLSLIAVAPRIPAIASVMLLAVLLIILNIVEHRVVKLAAVATN